MFNLERERTRPKKSNIEQIIKTVKFPFYPLYTKSNNVFAYLTCHSLQVGIFIHARSILKYPIVRSCVQMFKYSMKTWPIVGVDLQQV